ncbi:hypothetical protein [Salinimicrobium sp. TH3]|uniref:hypothetical protein n=1 Tax=Salinimicrobium sp. TH3 TaxID=2997342 RepID=UPI002276784D|nr:hypothetical protein [Salinimicrobium sp. TH3]MCY2686636.1 hypothetical protein [Salinimicrobium sp. TH3]
MRFFISISLSVLLLFQSFNFGAADLLCFDELVAHARVHFEDYGDSFFVFLTKHYGSQKEDHSASHEGHENLPFRPDHSQTTVNLFVPEYFESPQPKNPLVSQQQVIYFHNNNYTSLNTTNIFQPPRHA